MDGIDGLDGQPGEQRKADDDAEPSAQERHDLAAPRPGRAHREQESQGQYARDRRPPDGNENRRQTVKFRRDGGEFGGRHRNREDRDAEKTDQEALPPSGGCSRRRHGCPPRASWRSRNKWDEPAPFSWKGRRRTG